MRRALTTALVGGALVLAGCSVDAGPGTPTAPGELPASTGVPATDAPTDEDEAPADGAPATAAPGDADGGEEGQAAADVAKAFLLAMVDADPKACDYLLSFTDVERPMTEVRSDHETCVELLPEVLKAETQSQGLDPEAAAALEGLQITGADVDGDTAVVGADHYADEFAEAMGQTTITLKRIDGDWYVDLDNSFATPTDG